MAEKMIVKPADLYNGGFGAKYGPERPNRPQVEICKLWLRLYITPRKTFNARHGSYGLKHYVEEWAGEYVANGAFIQAAIELGYKYKRYGPNAIFNMSWEKAIKEGVMDRYGYSGPCPWQGKGRSQVKELTAKYKRYPKGALKILPPGKGEYAGPLTDDAQLSLRR